MALAKLLLTLLPLLLQICTAAPASQCGIPQEVLTIETIAASSIRKALKESEIIPDVLDDFHPSFALSITYPRSHQIVNLGNTLSVDDVQSAPDLEVHPTSDSAPFPSSKNTVYTLILTDPDATSRADPKSSEYLHWIATNITDLSSQSIIASQADELIKYAPPAPPPKTGKHRYVFVLLAGPEGTKLTKPAERPHWGYGKVRHGVRDWAAENGLVVLGANFFYAQNKQQ